MSDRTNAPALEFRRPDQLRASKKNPRRHSPAQIEQIKNSIQRFGWTRPILITADGEIIAGEAAWRAAKALKYDQIPVVVLAHLDARAVAAYRIADNRLALDATWDDAMLGEIMRDLQTAEFDLASIGFSDEELDALLLMPEPRKARAEQSDQVPPTLGTPIPALGDLWELGAHRLVCGDSTDPAAAALALGDRRPHLMVTDPPYGVEYDPNWRNERARTSAGMGNRALGAGAVGQVLNDDRADWREAWALFPGIR